MLSLAIHNPPKSNRRKGRKARRNKAPSAAQLRARANFARMARAKAKGRKRKASTKKHRTKRTRVVFATSTRRATTVPSSNRRRRGRRRGGKRRSSAFVARGFSTVDTLTTGAAALGAFIAVNKIPDMLPASISQGSDYKRLAVKAGITAAVYYALRTARMHKFANAALMGGLVNVGYDLAKKFVPQVASTGMSGVDQDELMGEMFRAEAARLSGGMGEMFNPGNTNRVSLRAG